MISYNKGCLREAESLRSKDGLEALQSVKECVQRL